MRYRETDQCGAGSAGETGLKEICSWKTRISQAPSVGQAAQRSRTETLLWVKQTSATHCQLALHPSLCEHSWDRGSSYSLPPHLKGLFSCQQQNVFVFTGAVKDHKALGKGNSSLLRVLQAGLGAGALIGSEELGKHRAVIRSVGLDSKHHKQRKVTAGRTGVGVLRTEAIILWGTLMCEQEGGRRGSQLLCSPDQHRVLALTLC